MPVDRPAKPPDECASLADECSLRAVWANWQVHDPAQGTVASADWYLRENPAYFHGPDVRTLQRRYGLTVVPYAVDDAAVMQRVIDLGVDGIITDDPELLISVARPQRPALSRPAPARRHPAAGRCYLCRGHG